MRGSSSLPGASVALRQRRAGERHRMPLPLLLTNIPSVGRWEFRLSGGWPVLRYIQAVSCLRPS